VNVESRGKYSSTDGRKEVPSMSQTLPERRASTASERWEPQGELEQVTERMRRLLEQTFGGFSWTAPLIEKAGWSPLVDLEETDDAYVVEAELPGVRREDVNVELIGNELTITGEIKERERKGTVRRRTRHTGRFEYRVSLPSHVDAEKIEASLGDGVLTVRVPKSERAHRRRIEIKQ
jgi:HSP20 family protein